MTHSSPAELRRLLRLAAAPLWEELAGLGYRAPSKGLACVRGRDPRARFRLVVRRSRRAHAGGHGIVEPLLDVTSKTVGLAIHEVAGKRVLEATQHPSLLLNINTGTILGPHILGLPLPAGPLDAVGRRLAEHARAIAPVLQSAATYEGLANLLRDEATRSLFQPMVGARLKSALMLALAGDLPDARAAAEAYLAEVPETRRSRVAKAFGAWVARH